MYVYVHSLGFSSLSSFCSYLRIYVRQLITSEIDIYVAFLRCATIFLLTYVYVRSRRKASHALNCSHISILTVTESVFQALRKDRKDMMQRYVGGTLAHFNGNEKSLPCVKGGGPLAVEGL